MPSFVSGLWAGLRGSFPQGLSDGLAICGSSMHGAVDRSCLSGEHPWVEEIDQGTYLG